MTRVKMLKEECRGILNKARKNDLDNWAIDLPPKGVAKWPLFPPGADR